MASLSEFNRYGEEIEKLVKKIKGIKNIKNELVVFTGSMSGA